jgi:dipeptidyl aminopeptidase/acylaminoacyl peptidase
MTIRYAPLAAAGAVSLFFALPTGVRAQASSAPARPAAMLTVDSITRGPDLTGYPPESLRWSADSQRLFFEWRRTGEDEASTYVVARDGGAPRKLTDEEAKDAPPARGVWDAGHKREVAAEEGDIVMFDERGQRHQVTRTTAEESSPRWARHDTAIAYVREGNLFVVPVDGTTTEQLTDNAPKKPDTRLTDSQEFIRGEEEKLFDVVREDSQKKQKADEKKDAQKLPGLELKERQSAADLMLAPDGVHVFIVVSERPVGARNIVVPSYVNETGYTQDINGRTDVGDAQARRLLAVLNLETGKSVWADGSFAPAVKEPQPSGESEREKPPAKAEREIRWSMPGVSDDGQIAVAGARSADNKDRWFVTIDPDTGSTKVIDALHDDAWIHEVGGSFRASGIDFIPGTHRAWFLSERDGWMHLYVINADRTAGGAKQLTSGKWEVTAAELSPDHRTFYLTTTEGDPGQRQLYTMPVDGGSRTKVTSMVGSNEATVSPDGSKIGVVYSYSTKPPEVYLMANTPGASATRITTSPTEEWQSFHWIDPKVITYKARDGADVYARLYTPEMIGAKRDPSHPAVVFVHGAGYLQNAHKYWSSYSREYMFNNLLASKGYVVLDPDYRASSGYGRDWRAAIYRHMGGQDLDDVVDGARFLAQTEQVDPRRIGVYGGSYGGFITLMAMFTTPDVFAAGAALRPVSDWAHYNHGYTSNILNVPQEDAEAYRKSSPIYYADGLKGALLICHGMVDTNVQFQDSVRLVQRLIELRKENWEFAPYPVENHGFLRDTSWADEYKRILKLFENNLRAGRPVKGTA